MKCLVALQRHMVDVAVVGAGQTKYGNHALGLKGMWAEAASKAFASVDGDFDPASVAVSDHIEGMLGIKVGIGMQFVNGKEWAFVIIMMSQFIEPLGGGMTGIATIMFVTLTMCLGAMILWTLVGARLNHLFTEGTTGKRIFQVCGLLLGLLWVAFLVQGPAVPAS